MTAHVRAPISVACPMMSIQDGVRLNSKTTASRSRQQETPVLKVFLQEKRRAVPQDTVGMVSVVWKRTDVRGHANRVQEQGVPAKRTMTLRVPRRRLQHAAPVSAVMGLVRTAFK